MGNRQAKQSPPTQAKTGGRRVRAVSTTSEETEEYPETTDCSSDGIKAQTFHGAVRPQPAYEGQKVPPQYLYTNPFVHKDDPPAFYYGVETDYKPVPYAPPPEDPPPAYEEVVKKPKKTKAATSAPLPTYDELEDEVTISHVGEGLVDMKILKKSLDAPESVTHVNFHDNELTRISNLHRFPNLLRLTLSDNNLKSAAGAEDAAFLRWIDLRHNNLTTLRGLSSIRCLEWLDISSNDLRNLEGASSAPKLTWLNASENDMTSLKGVKHLKNLRTADFSSNDLVNVKSILACKNLQEVSFFNNNLKNVEEICSLSKLPYLHKIDIRDNDFSLPARKRIQAHFKQTKPECEVVMRL